MSPDDPGWRRPAPTVQERRIDLAIAVGLLVAAILSWSLYSIAGFYDDPAPAPVALIWAVANTLPLAARRRWPVPVAIIVSAAFIVGGILHVPELLVCNITLFLALYSVGAWASDRRIAMLSRALIVVAMFVWLLVSLFQSATDPDALPGFSRAGALSPLVAFGLIQILTNVLYFGAAYFFGDRARASAIERAQLEHRTAELEAERHRVAEQAVALDRVRIARELHDVVAHHVSVMGIQAGAARTVIDSDPDAAKIALGHVEDTSRTAIEELHRLLSTLRELPGLDDRPDAPSTVGVDALPALTDDSDAAGLPTSLTVVGEPRPLPPIVAVNLYRIAQEALTNARKHAGAGATADVRLRYLPDEIELEVGNTGAVRARRTPGGMGQLGMRERVAASGGSLEVGPRSRGGYLVRARMPAPASVSTAPSPAPVRELDA